jgi:hypothetical protein
MTHTKVAQLVVAALCIAKPVMAQSPMAHAYDKPSGFAWACGFRRPEPADRAKGILFVFHFRQTNPDNAREVFVDYDSLDNPRKVRASASEHGEDVTSMVTQTEMVWLGPSKPPTAIGVRSGLSRFFPDAFPDSPSAASGWTEMTRSENDRAREFAIWLRDHVCKKPPGDWRHWN